MNFFKKLAPIGASFLGGIVGGPVGGAIAGNLAEGVLAEQDANKAYKQQKADALANWNLQNAYNSPVEQMKRLKAAGLNPMLVYGSGNVTGNSSSSIDNVSVPVANNSGVSRNISRAISNLMLAQKGEDLQASHLNNAGTELDNEYKRLRNAKLKKDIDNYGFFTNNDVDSYTKQRHDNILEKDELILKKQREQSELKDSRYINKAVASVLGLVDAIPGFSPFNYQDAYLKKGGFWSNLRKQYYAR